MKILSGGIAVVLGVALSVAAALPAAAVTETTVDVPGDQFIDVTSGVVDSGFPPLVTAGPVVLPASFDVFDASYRATGITVGPPAAGCTRVVNSAMIGFVLYAGGAAQVEALITEPNGESGGYTPGTTISYEGVGSADIYDNGLGYVTVPSEDGSRAGTLTLTPPAPLSGETVLSFLGMFAGSTGQITEASFNVTDTCPDAAVVAAPAALPNMGAQDAAPLALIAFGALLVGGFALLATRRRAQH